MWGFWFSVIWCRVFWCISFKVSEELVAAIFEVVQEYTSFLGMLVLISLTRIWYEPKGNRHHKRLLTLNYCQYSHKTVIAEVVNTTVITVHRAYRHQMCWRLISAVIKVWMRQVTELQEARHRINWVHSDHCEQPQFSRYWHLSRCSGYISDGLTW